MTFVRSQIISALAFVVAFFRVWNKKEINNAGLTKFTGSTSHPLVIAFLCSDEKDGITKEIKMLLGKTKSERRSIWTTMGIFPWSPIFFARKGDTYPLNYFILTVLDSSIASRAEEAIVNIKSAFNGVEPSEIWVLKEEHTRLSYSLPCSVYNSVEDLLRACKVEFVK